MINRLYFRYSNDIILYFEETYKKVLYIIFTFAYNVLLKIYFIVLLNRASLHFLKDITTLM